MPSNKPDEKVWGHVFKLEYAKQVLGVLDGYEQARASDPQPTEYVRKVIEINTPDPLICWTYIYNWPVKNLKHIPSGNFLDAIS